ncbi:MAG: type II secretion system protein GspK [Thermodesulfobacteriota bacterium]|nr:type II secretion system protein GspK [Thermodesulfobacteriota bacterium]
MNRAVLKSIVHNRNGVALLVTLALISVLAAAAFELGRRVKNSASTAMQEKNRFVAKQMAVSGINLAMLILDKDGNDSDSDIDSLQEAWADPEKLFQAVEQLGFKKGDIELKISDELGKIEVNALVNEFPGNAFNEDQRKIWERFLNLLISSDKSNDQRNPSEIINCIKDWLDSEDDDAITGISGAESSYYEELDPPYSCTNTSFDLIEELFMVKGISRKLLQSKSKSLSLLFLNDGDFEEEETIEQPDLADFFTVFGMDDEKTEKNGFRFSGRVNINTADVMVLAALLPVGMEDQAAELAAFRVHKQEESGEFVNTLDKGWYEQVIDLSEKEKKNFNKIIRYSSSVFKAECTASVGGNDGGAAISLAAVIKREKNEESGKSICRIIKFSRK